MLYRIMGGTGLRVSILSLGAASLGDIYHKIDIADGIYTVHKALDLGINLIDVSPLYGYNKAETVLGRAIEHKPRDKFLLASKAGRYRANLFDFSPARLTRSVDESLQRLKTDYLDILQLHDIEYTSLGPIIHESIPTLAKLKEQGKIRFYGITGLPLKIFTTVAETVKLDTILSYCRYSLNDTSLLEILPYLAEKKIGIMNASPLSMGLLTDRGAPDWHPAAPEIKEACHKAAEFCRLNGSNLSKLALQFSVSHPGIATTIVGTANPQNIACNVQWLEETMDTQMVSRVQELLNPIRNKSWISGLAENNESITEGETDLNG